MNPIDQLLQGAAVEWKPLGEVAEIVTDFTAAGSFASNAKNVRYLKEPDYALLVRTTDLKSNFVSTNNFIYVDKHAFEYLWRVNLNQEAIILPNVGNCGEVYFITPDKLPHKHCVLGPNALLLRSSIANNRYLYYWFQCREFQFNLSKITSNTGQTKFNKTNLKKILIPLPPLSVQREIVRILDKFTSLEAELEAELDCRKRQYAYYRNQLLSLDSLRRAGEHEVKLLPLGEVFETRNGYTPSKSNAAFWENGTIAWFRMEDLRTNGGLLSDSIQRITPQAVKGKGLFKAGSIIMATTATIGEHALLIADSLANQRFTNFKVRESLSESLLPKFVYYYFFVIDEWCKQNVNTSSFPSVDMERLKKQLFPLPPLAEQARIVRILDQFDALTHSLSEGLPREIALRRQQYEYYRQRLLSFGKP